MFALDYTNCIRDIKGLDECFYHTFYAEESLTLLKDIISRQKESLCTENPSFFKRLIFNIKEAVKNSFVPNNVSDLELKKRVFSSVQVYLSESEECYIPLLAADLEDIYYNRNSDFEFLERNLKNCVRLPRESKFPPIITYDSNSHLFNFEDCFYANKVDDMLSSHTIPFITVKF